MKMTHKWMLIGAGVLIAGSLYAGSHGQPAHEATDEKEEGKLKPQTTCPIMGGAINENQYVDHEGKRIFVCCPPCREQVKADPEAAIATLAEAGQGPAQALCPIMNIPISRNSQHVDHEGQRIYVCCGSCVRRVKADPEAALKTLEEQGVVPANVPKAEEATEKHKH